MASFRSLLSLVTFALSTAATTAFSTYTFVTGVCQESYSWFRKTAASYLKEAVARFEAPSLKHPEPAKRLVQACAYAMSVAKRERPTVFQSWRMCPST